MTCAGSLVQIYSTAISFRSLSLSLEKMSDTETDLSSNSEEENDGGYSREELFVKDLFTVYFLTEANSSGIKSCRNGMDASANHKQKR